MKKTALNLNPRLRSGYEITREAKKNFLRNYHSKIEFLDGYVQDRGLSMGTSIEAIVWYHALRNQLYHSGNGMVPEIHVVEGAKQAALDVFGLLFDVDITTLLATLQPLSEVNSATISEESSQFAGQSAPASQAEAVVEHPTVVVTQDDGMELLRLYIEFEQVIRDAMIQAGTPNPRQLPIVKVWKEFRRQKGLDAKWDRVVDAARQARNQIAHGRSRGIDEDEAAYLGGKLMDLTELLRNHGDTSGPE